MIENDVNPPINNDPMEKRNEFIDHPSYVRKWQQDVACIKPNKVTNEDTIELRTYKIFKTFLNKKNTSQFRISAHKLEIVQGRYSIRDKSYMQAMRLKSCGK